MKPVGKQDDDFQKRLLATFRVEAEDHVRAMSGGLIELEKARKAEEKAPIVEKIFREAHSLKGAARAVNLKEIEALCQSLESVFAGAKRGEITLSAEALDLLHGALDGVDQLLISAGERTAAEQLKTANLARLLEGISKSAVVSVASATPAEKAVPVRPPPEGRRRPDGREKSSLDETVRISAGRLDLLLLQAEELLSAKLGAAQRSTELRELTGELARWKKEWAKVQSVARAIQPGFDRSGEPAPEHNGGARQTAGGRRTRDLETKRLLEFLEWNETFSRAIENKLTVLARSAEREQRSLGGMVDNLLRDTKRLFMLPFSSLTELFPRLARDLSREQGKESELVIRGEDIEIDRRILQEIKEPLIHLVRNCIDHGIEKPEERRRKNKSSQGTVTIAVEQKSGNKVEILISDDGVGIDPAKVKAAAVKLELVSPEAAEKMGEQENLALIFQSGVSTSPIITDISGRGLGMAIVREKVERLGGAVTLETRPEAGTTFRLLLPLTLSTFRGLVVRAGERSFIIPVTYVERVGSARKEDVQTVENRETIPIGGRTVSLARLQDALELPQGRAALTAAGTLQVVVLGAGDKRIAFHVDEVIGEQEVLVKGLGPQLARVRNIGGAAVLGTGKVVPVLNVVDLMKSAIGIAGAPAQAAGVAEPEAPRRKSLLVVDDSITARTLVKNILEGAGYDVKTAVDGAEAFATLREGLFDLVVSDVDMPRMNGFDLTARIRADKKLSDLPVVLVTALESRQDRERGIDVGANAYLVKSSFEQSNLLEIVRRFV